MSRIEMRKRKAAFENENNKKRKITRRQMDQEIAAKGVKNGDDLNDDWLIGYMNGDFDYPDVEIIEEEDDEKEDNKKRKMTRSQMDEEIATKAVENGDDLQDDWVIRYMRGDFDYPDVEIIEEEEDEKEDKDEETQEEKEDNVEDNDEEEEEGFVEIDGEIFIYCNCCFPPKKF